jgi:transcriptional regulator with XRE-family HTH domain
MKYSYCYLLHFYVSSEDAMANRTRAFSRQTVDAAAVLGTQIAQARRARGWTASELGTRIGVSARTISKVEQGSASVAIGIVFEAATMLGVPLFGAQGPELARLAREGREVLALLPSRVYHSRTSVEDDDF